MRTRMEHPPTAAASQGYWRNRICSALPGLSLDWLEPGPVHARLDTRRFGEALLIDGANAPVRVERRLPPGTPDGGFQLVLHTAGRGRYRCGGHEIDQQPGDLILLDTDHRFSVTHPEGTRLLIWSLPRRMLDPLLSEPELRGARHIKGNRGNGAVLREYARALAREAAYLDNTQQRPLCQQLCMLTARSLERAPDTKATRRQTARTRLRQQLLAYIETHLRQPRLTATRAAEALGISRRTLYDLLGETGEGFAARLNRRRLEEGRKLLADRNYAHLSIAEVAYHSGFGDLSTFHRRFRKQYRMTPGEMREGEMRRTRSG